MVACGGGVLVLNNCFLQQNTTASLLELYFNDSMQTTYAPAAAVAVNKERSPMGPMQYLQTPYFLAGSHCRRATALAMKLRPLQAIQEAGAARSVFL